MQIFDQNGKLIEAWSQFSRPSGCYIDRHDILYVSDSESRDKDGYGHHPGGKRGVRIGSAKTGASDGIHTREIMDPRHRDIVGTGQGHPKQDQASQGEADICTVIDTARHSGANRLQSILGFVSA
jgi:hypothetical protein